MEQTYVDKIIAAFGTARRLAREVGKPTTTVAAWKKSGSIPDAHKPAILAASQRLGLGLDRADFFPLVKDAGGE